MNQTDLIQKIIATEHQAKAMSARAKQEQAELAQNLDSEIAALRAKYAQNADDYLRALQQSEHEKSVEALKEIDIRLHAKLDQVESIYQARKDSWVEAIFERIVGKAGG